jgi:hypothetical protein
MIKIITVKFNVGYETLTLQRCSSVNCVAFNAV